MSTLTVCPYCGEAMRFDEMKSHFSCCEGRSPLQKSQSRHRTSPSPSPAKSKPVSGLEFYNQLNKLSQLTRAKSNSSNRRGEGSFFAASPNQRDAATVRELMYPSGTSLTIDVAPSPLPTSASSSHEQIGEEAQRRPSPSYDAPSGLTGTSSPLAAAPPPAAVRVSLNDEGSADRSTRGNAARSCEAGWEPVCPSLSSATSSRRSTSGQPVSSLTPAVRSAGEEDEDARMGNAVPSRLQPWRASNKTLSASTRSRSRSARSEQTHAKPSAEPTKGRGSGASQRETTSADSVASSQRPPVQHSSFAIRLRGSGASSNDGAAAKLLPGSSTTFTATSSTQHDRGLPTSLPDTKSAELAQTVAQLTKSVQHLQQLVGKQQEQYNALLIAHADLNRQVATQQGTCNGVARRSIDQAAEMEAALQQHVRQWQREKIALTESVAALWAHVSEAAALQDRQLTPQLPQQLLPAPRQELKFGESASLQQSPQPSPALAAPSAALTGSTTITTSNGNGSLPADQSNADAHPASLSAAPTPAPSNSSPAGMNTSSPAISIQRAAAADEESAYYSDIASFIHQDAPVFSASTSTLLNHTLSGGQHPSVLGLAQHIPRAAFAHLPSASTTTTSAAPTVSGAEWVSRPVSSAGGSLFAAAPQFSSYTMDVQQKRHLSSAPRMSIEDRVVSMLHAKPTVVIQHSPWR